MKQGALAFLVGTFVFCCGVTAAQQNTADSPAAKGKAANAESDLVVARVLGEPITETQMLSAIEQLARQKILPPDQLKDRNTALFKDAMDSIVTVILLRDQVKKQNIQVDKAVLDQQMQQIAKQFPSREDFVKAMASQGVTEEQLRKSLEDRMSLQLLVERVTSPVPAATEEEINKFYHENPNKFVVQEQVHASHILLRVDPKSTPEQKAEIKKKLEQIRSEIESNAISFKDAAAKYSQDPSNARDGGDLGFFPRGTMVKPFEDAAFATKPGTISPVIETQFGYHIIQVSELKPAGKATLGEARATIKNYLEQLARQKTFQKYVDELKSKAEVETFMSADEFAKRHPQ